jgi:hypothetical protein
MAFKSDDIKVVEGEIPQSRVSAFANREFAAFLKETPIVISEAENLDWKSSTDGEKIYAEASVVVPVKLIFNPGNLNNDVVADDLKLSDIEISGKSQLGIKFENKPLKEELDPLDTVNVASVIAQAQKEHWD